jgi:hypothetical protein
VAEEMLPKLSVLLSPMGRDAISAFKDDLLFQTLQLQDIVLWLLSIARHVGCRYEIAKSTSETRPRGLRWT